jgi:hypothetical protein
LSSKTGGKIKLKCEFHGQEKIIIKKREDTKEDEENIEQLLNNYR